MLSTKSTLIIGALVVAVGCVSFVKGREAGNDARDRFHLNQDLSGSLAMKCESLIADKPRNNFVYIDFGKQTIYYNGDELFKYTSFTVFASSRGISYSLLDTHAKFASITQLGNYARVSLRDGDHTINYMDCETQDEQ